MEHYKTVPLKKEYIHDPNNPLPLLLNQERVTAYLHSYTSITGSRLPLKKHTEYCEQFEKSIIKGGQKTYDLLTKKNSNIYNETPKTYLQDMTSVICFLYSELLAKSAPEAGPQEWSLILEDPHGMWEKFFIKDYLHITNKNEAYIQPIKTSHLAKLTLKQHYGITTDIAPESIEPYFLPHNDDTILVIPYETKEKKLFFLRTGKNAETGWFTFSLKGAVNGVFSYVRRKGWLSGYDTATTNTEHLPDAVKAKILELFPETNPKKLFFLNEIYTLLKEKESEDFGKEKNEAIKNVIYELESTFDHLDIRLGNEVIFDADELRSASLAYALLALDEKKNKTIITEDYARYFSIISKLRKLKYLIFLHNHISEKKYPIKDIRNTVDEIIQLKSTLTGKIPDLIVEPYCVSVMDLLKLILTSKEGDVHLCSRPIFEQPHHKFITIKIMNETALKPSPTPDGCLVLPNNPKQESE